MADDRRDDPIFDAELDVERPADHYMESAGVLELDFDPASDPPRDPALATALRGAVDGAVAGPEWERLHHAIQTAAAFHLARRRVDATWWQHAAGWAGRAIPVGLAASIALVFGLRVLGPHAPLPEPAPPAATLESMLLTLLDDALETTLPADGDELLRVAFPFED